MITVSGVELFSALSLESSLDLFDVGVITSKSSKMSSSSSRSSLSSVENKNWRFLVDSDSVLVLELTERTGSGHWPVLAA